MNSLRKLPVLIVFLISLSAFGDPGEQMKIVEFNGFGAPKLEGVKDGDILVLFKPQESIEIVKLKILPPNEYGPELTHAENSPEFESELKKIIEIDHPQLENTDRHWVLTCPESIIRKVKF